MTLAIAVLAGLAAFGGIAFSVGVNRRLQELEPAISERVAVVLDKSAAAGMDESQRMSAALDQCRADCGEALSEVSGGLTARLEDQARRLDALGTRLQAAEKTASTCATELANQIADASERSRDAVTGVRCEIDARFITTVSEVAMLLRNQTDSLRADLVARLAEQRPTE